uniref:Uncharacterized protein n=1 Tax=Anguilla anguilla TaxID=7936 RepID=A0A0E9RTW1_ANGAN
MLFPISFRNEISATFIHNKKNSKKRSHYKSCISRLHGIPFSSSKTLGLFELARQKEKMFKNKRHGETNMLN